MSEEQIITHCSPTLAGIKTANLFGCVCDDFSALTENIRSLNRRLSEKGIAVVPLDFDGKRALIYVYRPALLRKDLKKDGASAILKNCGYDTCLSGFCILNLMKRLRQKKGFPHEIGLFLGYPPEDVSGFIENNAENYKFSGFWKVYGNEKEAKKLFAKFRKCTKIYCNEMKNGIPIEKLTVVV